MNNDDLPHQNSEAAGEGGQGSAAAGIHDNVESGEEVQGPAVEGGDHQNVEAGEEVQGAAVEGGDDQNGESDEEGGQGTAAAGIHHNVEDGEEVQGAPGGAQGSATGGVHHQNVEAGEEVQDAAVEGGAPEIGPVLEGIHGFTGALNRLEDASASISAAVNRIRQVTEVTTVVPALRDVMYSIDDSAHQIDLNSVYMFMYFEDDPHRVMFPAEIRTMELGARMVSTSVMWLHSLLQFNSDLRVDGHGPRYRIHREIVQQHLALSQMQTALDLLFSLEPPGYVYVDEGYA